MANIINNNFNFYKLKPYRGEYWDLILNKDICQTFQKNYNGVYDSNLITYFDLSDNSLFDGIFVNGLSNYKWENSYSTEYVLENIGYTGFDNGLLYFERDKIRNEEFPKLYSESQYKILQENNLKLHFVTGSTKQYSYEYEIEEDSVKLNGGFLQGFFKTECDKYEVLPSSFKHGDSISFEFVLKPSHFPLKRFSRLNDVYPKNKGFFFYIGTRAENKWIYLYEEFKNEITYDDYIDDSEIDITSHKLNAFVDMKIEFIESENDEDFGSDYLDLDDLNLLNNKKEKISSGEFFNDDYVNVDDECNCEFEYIENEMDISDFIYQTKDKCFTLGQYEDYVDYNNPFLLFNRTCDGFNAKNKQNDSFVRYMGLRTKKNDENLFLTMNRTLSGYTTTTLEKEYETEIEKYDIYADLYENALGFRITDEGEIGYRYLIQNKTVPNKLEMVEGYSKKNIIEWDKWNHVVVKMNFVYDKMFFKFYVNGKLVFISKFLPKLNLRELDEIYEKQETVPYNISIGGGTQGLSETILPNYMINPYRIYPLEENFGGTFIGYIKTFRIYLKDLNYNEIFNNFQYEFKKILK